MVPVSFKKNSILIVDDNFINRELLKNVFEDDYFIFEAENGLEGLEIVDNHENRLRAILLDVNMPKMNGIEMLKVLFEKEITKKIPVFMVTAYEDIEIAKEAYYLGAMDVLNKPIIPVIISKRVESIIELFRSREKLNETVNVQANTIDELHRSTIEALATAIEFRDVESGEHTNRIYAITKYILSNTEMGEAFTDDEIESMSIGSIMHDIGKISIPDYILNKPGKLTLEEYELMKEHTVKGGMLMEKLTSKQSHDSYIYACDIARHHHERYDGKGYPDGLVGDEISIWSQVVSIADVYDALVSHRVYKKAYDPNTALKMILNNECGVFNPKLIKCFLEVEPVIRSWYENSVDEEQISNQIRNNIAPKKVNTAAESLRISQNLTEVLLLMNATKAAYDLIIFANLSKNSYYMLDYERFLKYSNKSDGIYEDLINNALLTIPEDDYDSFKKMLDRESLLKMYREGEKRISLVHKQYDDSHNIHLMETIVLLIEDVNSGDIINVILSHEMKNKD